MKLSTYLSQLKAIHNIEGLSFEEIAKICLQNSIEYIDVEYPELSEKGKPVLDIFINNGFKISCMVYRADFIHNDDITDCSNALKTAKEFNISNILLVPGFWNDGDKEQECLKKSLMPMKKILEKAEELGINIGFEDYDAETPVSTSEGILYYLENLKGTHCIFDTANFLYMGEEVLSAFNKLKPYIKYQLHCKDKSLTPKGEQSPSVSKLGEKTYATAVGKGVMPVEHILNELKSDGFDGILTIELFGSKQYLSDLKASAEYLKKFL